MADLALIQPKESAKAAQAFADYVAMGPGRSLRKLVDYYNRPPSYLRQLAVWASEYHWQERLKAMAGVQIEQAAEHRTSAYIKIAGEYDRRVSDEAGLRSARLTELHGIFDRVKPDTPASQNGGGSIAVRFVFEHVTRAE